MSLRMMWTCIALGTCVSVVACGFGAEEAKKPTTSAFAGSTSGGSNTAGSAPLTAGTFGAPMGGDTGSSGTFSMPAGGSGGESVGGGGAGTAGSVTAGTGGTGAPLVCPAPANAELPLPLPVSGNFAPSGYFAGPTTETANIMATACEARPAENTVGECYKFSFKAATLAGDGAYAGVFWQNTNQNWGTGPGTKVAAGATKVTFKAWGVVGGEKVDFSAGGIGDGGTLCHDGVSLGQGGGLSATLTTTPTAYSVDLKGQAYPDGIIGGFVWSTAVTSIEQTVAFYVDEIQWVQ